MALTRLTIDGYGQLELNNAPFRRDGRVEAQCALKEADFGKNANAVAENGMLLAIDRVNREVKLPAADEALPIAINYSAEHMYDERANALKDFFLKTGDFYPRLGYLSVGDLFTTNCICFDDTEFKDDDAFIAATEAIKTTALYGGISVGGAIKVSATAPTVGPVLRVVEKTTMPDGQFAVKFHVNKA